MSAGTVSCKWLEGELFVGKDRFGTSIVIGSTPGREPEFRGAKPSDLLVLGLISCAGYDLVSILQKQRYMLEMVEISADSEQQDEPPFTFTRIHLHYRLRAKALLERQVARAIKLSQEKYCCVWASLHPSIQLSSSFVIEDT